MYRRYVSPILEGRLLMNFQALIRTRYSVRAYKPDAVEEDKLARILEAARIAPTPAEGGLATCGIAAFDPPAARDVLGLPPDVIPAAFTPLGYPADTPAPKKRRPLTELVRRDRW